jgi:para-nitrobenzyl esterase
MPEVRQRLLDMDGEAYDEGTDGYVIPQSPGEVWSTHKEAPVPLMIGNTTQDTAATIGGAPIPHAKASPEVVSAWKQRILGLFYGKDPDLLERAANIYGMRDGPNEVSTYPPYGTPQLQLGVDLNHRCSSVLSASWHSAIAPTWLFEFSRTTPAHPPAHGSELRYIFGYDDLEDESSRKYSDVMQQYWTNFAKTGDPNGAGLPVWSKYDVTTKPSLEFTHDGPVQRNANRAVACAPYSEKYTRDPKPLTGGDKTFVRGPGVVR